MDAGLVVFAGVYALLAIPWLAQRIERSTRDRWPEPPRKMLSVLLSRPGLALTGAALLLVLGLVGPSVALHAIDWRTLALLGGMMLLVAALDVANVFAVLASRLARALPTPRRLLVGSMVVVAVLSALVLNDAVVLLFTPVLVRAARAMGANPFPLLAGEAFAANLGSAATPVGNPQNALIATALGLNFVGFAAVLAQVALVCLVAGIVICLAAFRRDLDAGPVRAPPAPEAIRHPAMLVIAIFALGVAFIGFVGGPSLGIPLWASALGAGCLALLLSPLARVSPTRIARGVDVGILGFFVGLFVLLQVVRDAGILETLGASVARAGSGGFIALTAVLSNLVSNVPAVILLLPTVQSAHEGLRLAAASTLAGNLTFLGSAATVIVAETARRHGAEFHVGRFTLIGLAVGTVTLGIAWLMLG